LVSATPSSTLPRTVFDGIEPRLLREEADRDAVGGNASPMNWSSPAMMRSSELLPAPFRPRTPILAPGRNDSQMSFEDDRVGRMNLPEPFHRVDVLHATVGDRSV
jgi:hypothetical protein